MTQNWLKGQVSSLGAPRGRFGRGSGRFVVNHGVFWLSGPGPRGPVDLVVEAGSSVVIGRRGWVAQALRDGVASLEWDERTLPRASDRAILRIEVEGQT